MFSEYKIDRTPPEPKINRRDFLKKSAKIVGGALLSTSPLLVKKLFENKPVQPKEQPLEVQHPHKDEPQPTKEMPKTDEAKNEPNKEEKTEKVSEQETAEQQKRAKMTIQAVATALEKLPKNEFFPKQLFDNDLLIAIRLQESKDTANAISRAGAVGSMQNTSISILEVLKYLSQPEIKKMTRYAGPETISQAELKKIKELILTKRSYGYAFGQGYLGLLWQPQHGYGIGYQKKYKNESEIRQAQKLILSCYNGGLNNVFNNVNKKLLKPEKEWPIETQEYYQKVFIYRFYIARTRKELQSEKIKLHLSKENYFATRAARNLKIHLLNNATPEIIEENKKIIKKSVQNLKSIYLPKHKISEEDIQRATLLTAI